MRMTKAEERQWLKENWPKWKNILTFKKHTHNKSRVMLKGRRYLMLSWSHTERRTKPEKLEVIDQMLRDLGQDPEAE